VASSAGLNHEDHGVTLLVDIRQVFDARRVDRIFSQSLVEALVAMEGAPWSEWRGKAGDRPPPPPPPGRPPHPPPHLPPPPPAVHAFTAAPLRCWPAPRMQDSKSRRGFLRRQFGGAWAALLPLGRRATCARPAGPTQRVTAAFPSLSRHAGTDQQNQ